MRISKCFSKLLIVLIISSVSIPSALFSKNKELQIISLTNGWEMRQADTEKWIPAVVPGCVHSDLLRNKLIPEPYYRTNEKGLQWIDKKDWEYNTVFKVNADEFNNSNLELVFKGLDTYADVYLNGKEVLKADNMFREWTVAVKPLLKKGDNELRVYFHSPVLKGLDLLKKNGFTLHASNDQAENGGLTKDELLSPYIRKAPYHFGWDWGPRFVTSGIWQPIFLRAWDELKINDFYVSQKSLTDQKAQLNGQVEIQSDKTGKAEIIILVNEKEIVEQDINLKKGSNIVNIPFVIQQPKRWWSKGLGDAYLYRITAKVSTDKSSDDMSRNIGLRTLKLIQNPDSAGHTFYFELNGIPVFAKGENHIPNDMFLEKVTNEVYDWEIETAVKSNLNMLRVWGGGIYENDYFYDLCDRNGILVWQDFMFACTLYPGNEWFLNSVSKEVDYQVKRLRNHPSIALWCGNNEIDVAWQNFDLNNDWGWKKTYSAQQREQIWAAYDTIFNKILPAAVHAMSAQTAYWHSSPASLVPKQHANDKNANGDVHYWGVWWGKHPFEKYAENIGRFMSEYGFQSFPELETVKKYALPADYDIESEVIRHHQRSSIGNVTIKEYMDIYYRKPLNFEKFLYVGQVLQAYGIQFAIESHRRAMPFNMGSLVWQINDCWPVASWSSSDYYHRWKALQYEIKRSFEPVIVSAYSDGENTIVKIVSDKLQNIEAQLKMNIYDFAGKLVSTKSFAVNVKSNGITDVIKDKTSNLTLDPQNNYMTFSLKSKESALAEKIYFFTQPKNMNLSKPNIITRVEIQGANWVVTLNTNVLAKNVYLNYSGIEGFFSDNYFDLLPGIEHKVTFTPVVKNTAISKLSIMSLVDSYQ